MHFHPDLKLTKDETASSALEFFLSTDCKKQCLPEWLQITDQGLGIFNLQIGTGDFEADLGADTHPRASDLPHPRPPLPPALTEGS